MTNQYTQRAADAAERAREVATQCAVSVARGDALDGDAAATAEEAQAAGLGLVFVAQAVGAAAQAAHWAAMAAIWEATAAAEDAEGAGGTLDAAEDAARQAEDALGECEVAAGLV